MSVPRSHRDRQLCLRKRAARTLAPAARLGCNHCCRETKGTFKAIPSIRSLVAAEYRVCDFASDRTYFWSGNSCILTAKAPRTLTLRWHFARTVVSVHLKSTSPPTHLST
jgi:hypothetical protein